MVGAWVEVVTGVPGKDAHPVEQAILDEISSGAAHASTIGEGCDVSQSMSEMKPWDGPPGAYAGIGSRETPPDVLSLMRKIAARLSELGWVLRSGGAPGADTVFEEGAGSFFTEVFLPWPGFAGRRRNTARLLQPTVAAQEIASRYHPGWARLSDPARKLIARNTHQVLGADCESPSKFVLCWTPDGAVEKTTGKTGGTGQAIRLAAHYKIPTFNLKRPEHRALWEELAG